MAAEINREDDDDPVVQEVDICLAKSLSEKLFLYQYPVRPGMLTYDHASVLEAKMKVQQQKVELELGMDVSSETYCYSRGEQIADAVDRCIENQRPTFPSRIMDRHVLTSVRATEECMKYAAAVYYNGALHITPLKGIVQLRPGFNYFDKAEENQKKPEPSSKDLSQSEDEEEAKPVQLRFSRVKQNIQQKTEEVDDEEWTRMKFFSPQDQRSLLERNLMYCMQEDFESPEFTVTSRDYLQLLSPQEQQDILSPADMPHGVLSLSKLKMMDLSDQIKALLITAKVFQFSQLCGLLGGGLDEQVVLRGLAQYAMLVQGCWVVKSEVLYPVSTKSNVSGLDAEKLWPSRDYVMFCLNRKHVLSRKEVAAHTRLPTEELREVLEQLARHRPAQGWVFRLSPDVDFLHKHADICKEQAAIWKHKYKKLVDQLNLADEFSSVQWDETTFPGLFHGPYRKPTTPRRRTIVDEKKAPRRRTASQCSNSAERRKSSEESASIKKIDFANARPTIVVKEESLTEDAVAKTTTGKRRKARVVESDSEDEEMQMDSVASEKNCNEIEVQSTLDIPSQEIFIPPKLSATESQVKPPSSIFLSELKRFCRESILSGCLNLADLKELLHNKQQEAGSILCTGVTDDLLISCILATGGREIKCAWGEENIRLIPEERRRLFIYPTLNESTDMYRQQVICLFESMLSVRRKDIFEHLKSALNDQPTIHTYSKFMSEFCENHHGYWYLVGVYQTLKKYNPTS